jgi:hypothetical protein
VWLGIGAEHAHALGSDDEPLVKAMLPWLKSAGKAARIYFAATCQADDPVLIPEIDINNPPPGEPQPRLADVRRMLRSNTNVVVTEDPAGIIRVRIGEFPDAILRTRISRLSLSPVDQYNAAFARDALLDSEEMVSAAKDLGLIRQLFVYSYLVRYPAPGLPHMPASLGDLTADQVLDTIATSFNGVVLYGVCAQSGLFKVDVVHR